MPHFAKTDVYLEILGEVRKKQKRRRGGDNDWDIGADDTVVVPKKLKKAKAGPKKTLAPIKAPTDMSGSDIEGGKEHSGGDDDIDDDDDDADDGAGSVASHVDEPDEHGDQEEDVGVDPAADHVETLSGHEDIEGDVAAEEQGGDKDEQGIDGEESSSSSSSSSSTSSSSSGASSVVVDHVDIVIIIEAFTVLRFSDAWRKVFPLGNQSNCS